MASSSSAHVPVTSASAAGCPAAATAGAGTTSSPCAACKFLRRKCQPDCVFAPYFPPDQPQKFVHVHRVFGASNVTKLLNELHPYQREDAVNSLAYEADMRLRDPVYGCVGVISILQHQLRQLQMDLAFAKSELSKYQSAAAAAAASIGGGSGGGGSASLGFLSASAGTYSGGAAAASQMPGFGLGREQFFPATGAAAQPRESNQTSHLQMMLRNYDADLAARLGINGAYDAGLAVALNSTSVAAIGLFGGPLSKHSSAGGDERPAIGPL